ncbi:MAG: hypothetical protein JSV21_02505 [Nitrospirota bacterium]|nr:MAG: hypothetical protein JSV21_02505 [Nitrospirota bacterium]
MSKIAVLVRERQEEGLRMAVGATLRNDKIDVYVLGSKVAKTERNMLNLETMNAIKMDLFTNCPENKEMTLLSDHDIAKRLLGYDHILTY